MKAPTHEIIILTYFSSCHPSCLINAAVAIFAIYTNCAIGICPKIAPA